jgi:hypothetical protein
MSKAYSVDVSDLVKVGKNALLVGVAALLTYLGENLANLDLGNASALVVPIVVVAINTVVRWVKDNTK